MPEVNITNSAGRDAMIPMDHVVIPKHVRWLDEKGRQASPIRVIKAPIELSSAQLAAAHGGLEDLSQVLIDSDPEVNLEVTGTILREVSRVYVDKTGGVAHRVVPWDIIRNPDGSERERRIRERPAPNVSTETPLKWSGKYVPKADACRRFVFASKLQLMHINGLTYDFLYGIAKELHDRDSLMLLAAGPKTNQPLILRRGMTPHRGFLEGRIDGDRYCLLMHLTNQELKKPATVEEAEE